MYLRLYTLTHTHTLSLSLSHTHTHTHTLVSSQMSVFGFFNVKAVYYPWFLLTYHLVMGNGLNIFYIMGFVGKE